MSVGGFVEGYHELIGRSRFCLAPRGITPWTIHLYVAMLAGCIPAARCWQDLARDLKISGCKLSFLLKLARVNRFHSLSLVGLNFGGSQASRSYKVEVILSDDFEAPFQELLDWPSFSIKWPTGRMAELYDYLTSLPQQLVVEMKSAPWAFRGRVNGSGSGRQRLLVRLLLRGARLQSVCSGRPALAAEGAPTSLCGKLLATQGRRERACRHRWTMFLWRVYGLGF